MATVKLTSSSPHSRKLSSDDNTDSFRDVSFSSYLNTSEETFVRKLAQSNPYLTQRTPGAQDEQTKKEEDGEIGVFSAEKYFNGGIEDNSPRLINQSEIARKYQPKKPALQNDSAVVVVAPMTTTLHPAGTGTPSVVSESSWNSQSALLPSTIAVRNPSPRKTLSKAHPKSLLAALGCKCSDKESVDVDETVGEISFKKSSNTTTGALPGKTTTQGTCPDLEHKSRSGSWIREDKDIHSKNSGIGVNKLETCFSFPEPANLPSSKQHQEQLGGEIIKPRKSLEVFGSQRFGNCDNNTRMKLERRLAMLSMDATPRMEEEIDVSVPLGGVYDDNESDASSDLFEIDSLTGKINPFLARQGSDATSGCRTPTTCYAPSEASIEWSVVTASAADFSVVSDYEELKPPTSPIKAFPFAARTTRNTCNNYKLDTPIRRRRPGSLLGCKSQKAVRVAGDGGGGRTTHADQQRLNRVSDSYVPPAGKQQLMMGYEYSTRYRQQRSFPTTHSIPRPY
ncbi:hypothetical protein Tsubulata_029312 [Turnera subulata]|uniref:Protein PHYTOCHROME KINASE SUBSTRATE 1-like n=1 Tax=Turnera subulata TaxID=218843 RepID=A0A9Q0FDU8_9ROSI|nr:hypothetical protein Tsubulata_029312 [Turnera subulata]